MRNSRRLPSKRGANAGGRSDALKNAPADEFRILFPKKYSRSAVLLAAG
jgi:hypothetical protein